MTRSSETSPFSIVNTKYRHTLGDKNVRNDSSSTERDLRTVRDIPSIIDAEFDCHATAADVTVCIAQYVTHCSR